MKNVKIKVNQVGLVLINGDFKKILTNGSYWFWGKEEVLIYDKDTLFTAPIDLNIALLYSELADALTIVEVKDNEIAIQLEEGRFKTTLQPGKYAYWKGVKNYTYIHVNLEKIDIPDTISKQLIVNKLLAYVRVYTVESYENAVLLIDGKLERILEGGTYYWLKNNISISVMKADMRQLQLEISGQEILTKDKANLRLNFFVQYRITETKTALFENKDYEKHLYVLLQLALREYVGGFTFDELLEKKDAIGQFIIDSTADKVKSLGVELTGAGVRDIILPGDMKEIMNQVLIAEKKAQANVIMRREETASTRSLLNTAKLMEDNAMLWKLKEMEYVEKIADKINTISVSGNGQILDQLKQIFVK